MTSKRLSSLNLETTADGATLVMGPCTTNHVIGLQVVVPYPAAAETPDNAGLTAFALRMLRRGTTRLTAEQFENALDDLGTNVGTSAAHDRCAFTLRCTDDTIRESLALLTEMLHSPAFDKQEIERERRSTLAGLRRADDNSMLKTIRSLRRSLYHDHGYGLPGNGLTESVSAFTTDAITARYNALLNAGPPIVVAIGNFDPVMIRELTGALLAKDFRGTPPVIPPIPPVENTPITLRRQCQQAIVALGWRICNRHDPSYPAARLLSAVLGESMSSRFFLNLRDKLGLAYSTGTQIAAGSGHGEILAYIATKPQTRELALEKMLQEIDAVRNTAVPQEELDRARNCIIGCMLIGEQSNLAQAGQYAAYLSLKMGLDGKEKYLAALRAVTPDDLRKAAARYLTEPVRAELIPTDDNEKESDDYVQEQ